MPRKSLGRRGRGTRKGQDWPRLGKKKGLGLGQDRSQEACGPSDPNGAASWLLTGGVQSALEAVLHSGIITLFFLSTEYNDSALYSPSR